jgi:hypothetical protein
MTMSNRRDRSLLFLATAAGVLLASGRARAQSINAATEQEFPVRLINGQTATPRPANLNPTGINYADCMADMVLQYTVLLSGFPGPNDGFQVWATNDPGLPCVVDSARGIPDPTAATCWQVGAGLTEPTVQTSYQVSIPVRALVGPQTGSIPTPGTLVTDLGPEACLTQPSFAATSIVVWFVVIGAANEKADTAAMSYAAPTITADTIGPPAPALNPIADGDTLFNLTWTPTGDTDTVAYDIFIDPPIGGPFDAGPVTLAPRTLYCPDTGAPAASADATMPVASTDGTAPDALAEAAEPDAAEVTPESDADLASEGGSGDSGCFYVNGGSSAPASSDSTCTSTVLTASSIPIGTSTEVAAPVESDAADAADDAGSLVELDSGASQGPGGISSIPCQYLVGGSCPAGSPAYTNTGLSTVSTATASSYTITGLTNGITYDVAIAGVDGSGNVGPVSTCFSDYPAVVNDFFTLYRQAGGQAGGSFCALEAVGEPLGAPIVGVAFGALALTMARRRKKNASKD